MKASKLEEEHGGMGVPVQSVPSDCNRDRLPSLPEVL